VVVLGELDGLKPSSSECDKMKAKHGVVDVLFPAVRARLLRLLFTEPIRPHYVRELRDLSALSLHTVQDELRKLTALGLLKNWSNGYKRFYEVDRAHPLFGPLLRLVELNEELAAIKRSVLRRLPGRSRMQKKRRAKRAHLPPDRPMSWQRAPQARKRTRRL
jgi:hypothetical protein